MECISSPTIQERKIPIEFRQDVPGDRINELPLLTGTSDRISGTIKQNPEDFHVREIPLYDLEGDGPHLYFEVRKKGISTHGAVNEIAGFMEVSPGKVGYAGRKDADAVTTQRMSLEHADEDRLASFDHEYIEVNILGWHRNKLQSGHLAGNRFRIKIRDVPPEAVELLGDTVETLRTRGVPNYFGRQRFGRRGDTARLGKLLVSDRLDDFVEAYFGRPVPEDPDPVREAREAFQSGQFERAVECWPSDYDVKRRALSAFIERTSPKAVLSAIPKNRRQLFVSAFQARLFNEQVATRLDSLDRVFEGGIARKTDTGGMFRVEDVDAEIPRASRFEISPTGALPGMDYWEAEGEQGELERSVLENHGLAPDDFEKVSYLGAAGTRRVLRFKPEDLSVESGHDRRGDYLAISFRAKSGSFATVLLREMVEPV